MNLYGQRVTIFYDDGNGVSRKDGIVTDVLDSEYILDSKIIIPKLRIVRIEIR